MKRHLMIAMVALCAAALVLSGCSKSKKEAKLQGEAAELQNQVQTLETANKDLQEQMARAALKAEDEKRMAEDLLRAHQIKLMHASPTAFKLEPAAPLDNGWLIVDGERTFTLVGHTEATKVQFYWADGNNGLRPQLLGEDRNGQDGWSWKGTLPLSNMKAFWAEVHYGDVVLQSPVLAIRNGGK